MAETEGGKEAVIGVGVGLYYLSKEDELEDVKDDVKKLGQLLGGFSKEDAHGYIDHGQLC